MATSRSLNKVMLIGNLSRDPQVRYTQNGSLVCTFGLATNTSWTDASGQQKELTEWHNIVVWNKLGEICANLLCKGMLIYVEGELRTRVTENEDGFKSYRTEIKITEMKLLDGKDKSGIGLENAKVDQSGSSDRPVKEIEKAPQAQEAVNNDDDEVAEEDLPF